MAPSRGFHSDNFWVNKNYDKKMEEKRKMEETKKAPKKHFVITPAIYEQMQRYINSLDVKNNAGYSCRTFKPKNEIEIMRFGKEENYAWCIKFLNDSASIDGSDVKLYTAGNDLAVLEVYDGNGVVNGTIEMELKGSKKKIEELT